MNTPTIRPVRNRNRGMRMTGEGTIIINANGGGGDLYEVVPGFAPGIGPVVTFYDISKGRGERERKYLLSLSTSGTRLLMRWLPLVINAAERLHNRQRQQS